MGGGPYSPVNAVLGCFGPPSVETGALLTRGALHSRLFTTSTNNMTKVFWDLNNGVRMGLGAQPTTQPIPVTILVANDAVDSQLFDETDPSVGRGS